MGEGPRPLDQGYQSGWGLRRGDNASGTRACFTTTTSMAPLRVDGFNADGFDAGVLGGGLAAGVAPLRSPVTGDECGVGS